MTQRLATLVGQTDPHTVTFEVADFWLEEDSGMFDWSAPVQFRFERTEGGRVDLVFRTVTEVTE